MTCVFLTEENYAFVHSTDQKNCLHPSYFAYSSHISNKSGAIGVQHSSTPPPPVSTFSTHKKNNVLKSFQVKKETPPCSGRGLWPGLGPPVGGSGGGSAGPVIHDLNTKRYKN